MDIQAIKLDLIRKLLSTNSEVLLAQVQVMMDNESSFHLSKEHKRILDERLAAHAADPDDGASWEEVKTRVRNSR